MEETNPLESEQLAATSGAAEIPAIEPAPSAVDDPAAPPPSDGPTVDPDQAPPAPDAPPVVDEVDPPVVPVSSEFVENLFDAIKETVFPEPVNPFLAYLGKAGVYILEMGGCLQLVACTLVDVMEDGSTRIRLTQAAGVKAGEIIAPYSDANAPGTWHWA